MKWPGKYRNYYDYYADRLPLPPLSGIFLIIIGLVAFIVYALLN